MIAGLAAGLIGAVLEMVLLRRLYQAPELLQLLATFALVLVIKDFALWVWGPEDLLGPRAPGFDQAVAIAGRAFPEFDLLLIAIGPVVLGLLWLLLTRTRWGTLVRAATEDREMAGALGVNQAWLFTGVFALGSLLAGIGGAINIPREPATLGMDLSIISDVFVVVVVGGMGSIPGAFLAALLISVIKAFCIGIGDVHAFGIDFSFSKLTLVVEFIVMAIVLVIRPWGLLGRPSAVARGPGTIEDPLRAPPRPLLAFGAAMLAVLVLMPLLGDAYTLVLLGDILVFALFSVSLHFIIGPAGHALVRPCGLLRPGRIRRGPRAQAPDADGSRAVRGAARGGVGRPGLRLVLRAPVGRVSRDADAGLRADHLVGRVPVGQVHRRLERPGRCLARGMARLQDRLLLPHARARRGGDPAAVAHAVRAVRLRVARRARFAHCAPMRSASTCAAPNGRDSCSPDCSPAWPARCMHSPKGSISPEVVAIPRSVDGLVMVLLGGIQTLTGPVAGAAVFTWLQDTIARNTDFWRATLGMIILVLVLAFPQGVTGMLRRRFMREPA